MIEPQTNLKDKKELELLVAASKGDNHKIDELILKKTDVNTQDADGNTPLIWSLSIKNIKGVEKLIQAGANSSKKYPWINAVVDNDLKKYLRV